ncbi:MAG TPA: glycosyltransferase family 2 protein [Cyclobacteriaceae bacterium]|nr:glycosyltransferase family 2 protein [Cyclobacteriaceae bacterium]
MRPLVTIVTPSYNQGQFLERTILSVLQQDYPNIEYIVMDGGSKDNSAEIIKKYANKLAHWTSEKDKGQSDAINKGWKMGTGVYCCYLNSDDELVPGAVSAIVKVFEENPDVGVVYGDYTFVDENNKVIEEGKGNQTSFKNLLVHGQMPSIAQPSSFYRMDLVRKVNYIDESLHLSMDYDLLLKLSKASKIVYIPRVISLFRLHGNAKSTTLAKRHWHESLRVRRKYNILYSWKAILMYVRFRVFNLLPDSWQNSIRRGRNSVNDKLILGNKD